MVYLGTAVYDKDAGKQLSFYRTFSTYVMLVKK
jgi:hypothetical protein